eukprot:263483_1
MAAMRSNLKRERGSEDEIEAGNVREKRLKRTLNATMRLTVVKNSVHLVAVSEDGLPPLEASLNEGSSTDLPLETDQEVTVKTAGGRIYRFTVEDSEPTTEPEVEVIDLDSSDSESSEIEQQSGDTEPNQQGDLEPKADSDSESKIADGEESEVDEDAHMDLMVKQYDKPISVHVTARPSEDLSYIRSVIKSAMDVPIERQVIFADWDPVPDEGTLADAGITKKTDLMLFVRPRPVLPEGREFQLFVKLLDGKTIVLNDCRPDELILDLALKIRAKSGIPMNQLRLVFSGQQLEFSKCLSDYRIKAECTVHTILRLCGN